MGLGGFFFLFFFPVSNHNIPVKAPPRTCLGKIVFFWLGGGKGGGGGGREYLHKWTRSIVEKNKQAFLF